MEGNQMKMREVLCEIVLLILKVGRSIRADVACGIIRSKAREALSAPPRNCDVGTAEEQSDRFTEYCNARKDKPGKCRNCIFNESVNICAIEWAQMPYEAEVRG